MIIIKKIVPGIILLLAVIMLSSCNLEDFDMNKLADPDDVVPDLYAPLAFGTFKVEDLVVGTLPDALPIPPGGLNLAPIIMDKSGSSFGSAAVDSVYLISHINNETPVAIEFVLSFLSSPTGPVIGKTFASFPIPAGAKDFRIQFGLGPTDQANLMNGSHIGLNFRLLAPATGTVTYGEAKSTLLKVKIAFYAPVKLWELTK